MREQTEEIASLEKQMAAYRNDDSEEARAKIQELKVSLEDAKEELEETEYDRYISDQEKLLDELYLEYETILNERLDNVDLLMQSMIDATNTNAETIRTTLESQLTGANGVGATLSTAMSAIWNTEDFDTLANSITDKNNGVGAQVITYYNENFKDTVTTTSTAIGDISTDIASMISQLNKIAGTKVKSAKDSNAAKDPSASGKGGKGSGGQDRLPTEPKIEPKKPSGGDGKPKVGDKVKFVSGQYFYDSQGKRPLGSHYIGKEVYITSINNKSWATHPYHISTGKKLGSGDLGWLKLNQLSGYATGKKSFLEDEIAWTQENGGEFIVRPSDGAILTPLAKGDSVLNAAASNNIWSMANNPSEFIKDNLGIDKLGVPLGRVNNMSVEQNFENIVFSMPNVKNYEEMLKAMQKDKNFERLVHTMTIDQLAGKSPMAKNKALRDYLC